MSYNPLKILLRGLLLLRLKKPVPHSIRPLSQLDYVTVLVDATAPDAEEVCREVERFFGEKGLPLRLYCPSPKMLDCAGRIAPWKRSATVKPFILPRCIEPRGLFISLISDPRSFLSRYELRRSGACFKLACSNASASHADIALSVPEGKEISQLQLFQAVKACLERIV